MARNAKGSKAQKVSQNEDVYPMDVQEEEAVKEDSAVRDGNGGRGTEKPKSDGSQGQDSDGREETWDIVRVIPTAEEKLPCRHENCGGQAVAVWASSADLHDEWPLCEDCQLNELGGWPEGVDPIERTPPISRHEGFEGEAAKIEICQDECVSSTPISPSNLMARDLPVGPHEANSLDDEEKEAHRTSVGSMFLPSLLSEGCTPVPEGCTPVATPPPSKAPMPLTTPADDQSGQEELDQDELAYEDDEEQFDLKEILSIQKIQTNQVVCSGGDESCSLLACSVWVSSINPKNWYYCVDCQERDFDGWPDLEELPISHMDRSHMLFIATKCSRKRNPAMPSFPPVSPTCGIDNGRDACSASSKPNTHFVTPPIKSLAAIKGAGKDSIVADATSKAAGTAKQITPTTGVGVASASALATHKKWQKEAERLGSKNSRIIIDRKVAKKVIFETLYDSFCPTNINDLYKNLNAVIPSPVLTACLHEMSMDENDDKNLFVDSDEDDYDQGTDSSKNTPNYKKGNKDNSAAGTDPYGGSLKFKAGKNASTNVWYVDYTKLKDVDFDERQELAGNLAGAKVEVESLNANLGSICDQTKLLLSQPTNDKLVSLLIEAEKVVTELEEKAHEARKLQVNENEKKNIKQAISKMAKYWRERRKVVVEFLVALEENTDGQITMRKCLAGDGQIPLDSDEAVAKAAVAYSNDTRANNKRLGKGSQKRRKLLGGKENQFKDGNSSIADENFVAVLLNPKGLVERVYVSGEIKETIDF